MSADIPDVDEKPHFVTEGGPIVTVTDLPAVRDSLKQRFQVIEDNGADGPQTPTIIHKYEEQKEGSDKGPPQQIIDSPIETSNSDQSDQMRVDIIQDEHKSKVIKKGFVKRRRGKVFKSYKEYEMYLL